MTDLLRLWAPNARRIEAVVGESRIEMRRECDGWWAGPTPGAGEDYAFSIAGGPPRPDPRSRWQPNGVHGWSRWIKHAPLRSPGMGRTLPLHEAVIYELHVGTFSVAGTFDGAIPHLDHLVELGVYFADHESEELRRAAREGRRAEHAAAGWAGVEIDPIDPATRALGVLRWNERRHGEHAAMLAWYRGLIEVRRRTPALRDPAPGTTKVQIEGPLVVVDRGAVRLVCNLGDAPLCVPLGDVVLASDPRTSTSELPPWSCAIVRA